MAKKLSQEEFIEKVNIIHDYKYDYSNIKYINIRTPIEITCKVHHNTFMQLPKTHLIGKSSCKQCTLEKKQKTCQKNFGVDNPSQSKEIKKKKEQTCLKNHGVKYSMQSKALKKQALATNMERYGVLHPAQSEEIKEKARQTNLERYGVDWGFQSDDVKEKIKQTCIDKFDVEYALQSEDVKEKGRMTCLKNYGVEYNMQSAINREKSKQTCLKNYGVEYSLQSDIIKEKSKKTNLKRYGVENAMQSQLIQSKSRQTSMEKFGVEYQAQRHIPRDVLNKLNDKNWLIEQHHVRKITLEQIAKQLHVSIATVPAYIKKHNIEVKYFFQSMAEREIVEFIKQYYKTEIILNSRKIIYPYEIDIYLPELKLAFEYNGTYWHSELNGKDRKYHLNKTDLCNNNDIRLIHIWEYDWKEKKDIIKSTILSKLGKLPLKLDARKGRIVEVSSIETKKFMNDNHIQGHIYSFINLALMINNKIVSMMTFSKSRFSNNYQYELVRFASGINTNVRGASSKLFSYFKKTYNPLSIISYSDIGRNNGNLYNILGFHCSHISSPNFKYIELNTMHISSRLKFQKHKLEKQLPIFNESLTEWQNMKNNGYDRIWDCGNNVYVWMKD